MDDETFPDVTLANNSAMEQRALNARSQNESGSGKDTFVILRPKQKRYQITCSQTILVTLIAVLVLVVAIVITAFVTKRSCSVASHNCSSCSPLDKNSAQNNTRFAEPRLPVPDLAVYPWSGIRLPRSVIPTLYEIRIQIDLTTLAYQGTVNTTVHVNTSTKYIIFHRNKIDVDVSKVSVTCKQAPERYVVRQFEEKDKNFHVVEIDDDLVAGDTCTVIVGNYTGHLGTDLKGLYLSSYKNHQGETRYVV